MPVNFRRYAHLFCAVVAAATLAGCGELADGPTAAVATPRFGVIANPTTSADPGNEFLTVCKRYPAGVTGPDITVRLDVTGTSQAGTYSNLAVPANQCVQLWEHDLTDGTYESITVTEENPPAGFDASFATWQRGGTLSPSTSGTVAGPVLVGTGGRGATVIFTNTPSEVLGSEGCTPGYWKQSQHFGNWAGYAPTDLVNTVFGITFSPKAPKGQGSFDGTLLGALGLGGGGDIALVRAGAAALLSAASPSVAYPYTTAQVITTVKDALAAGGSSIGTAATLLDSANNLGCPLGRAP